MSERKVLNKYYPPDFDPSKIPRMKLPRNRQYTVRLMAPFNMRCVTCGEYIYKGKKFNARKEDVEGEDYLGIRIYRFYIKCTRCLQEISFKTDPRNTDYEIEAGATRNFMALKLAEEQAQREEDERKEDEATNPMKLLENRTKQSKQELELLESLEELRDLNRRQRLIDYDSMLSQYDGAEARRRIEQAQEEEDEKYIRSVFGGKDSKTKVVEEEIIDVSEGEKTASTSMLDQNIGEPSAKVAKLSSNVGASMSAVVKTAKMSATSRTPSVGVISSKGGLAGLVRTKQAASKQPDAASKQPDAASKQPDAASSKQPDAAASKQPDAAASKQPDAAASKQPDAAASKQPDAASKQPDAASSKQPDAAASKQPDAAASKQPDAAASKQPDAAASKQPDAAASKQPDVAASKQPDVTASKPAPSALSLLGAYSDSDGD